MDSLDEGCPSNLQMFSDGGKFVDVGVGNKSSEQLRVSSGVTQGSVLGSLPFLLYVNDFVPVVAVLLYLCGRLEGLESKWSCRLARDKNIFEWVGKWIMPINKSTSHLTMDALEGWTLVVENANV